MLPIYLPKPTEGMWKDIDLSFEIRWDFPNSIGALNGKHLLHCSTEIWKPVLQLQRLHHSTCPSKTLSVPEDKCLPGAEDLGRLPYVMVGDAAFPLKPYLMKAYTQGRIYREERARMTVETAFSILSSRCWIFHRDINLMPETTDRHQDCWQRRTLTKATRFAEILVIIKCA